MGVLNMVTWEDTDNDGALNSSKLVHVYDLTSTAPCHHIKAVLLQFFIYLDEFAPHPFWQQEKW